MRLVGAVALTCLLGGCAVNSVKTLRFAEHPYCTLVADGTHYRFHHDRSASAGLSAAAARWPQQQLHLRSSQPVEFDCLRSVIEALKASGKTVSYRMDE